LPMITISLGFGILPPLFEMSRFDSWPKHSHHGKTGLGEILPTA
jgi:hypothetical protein